MNFNFSLIEINKIQRIWDKLNFYNKTHSNIRINEINFKDKSNEIFKNKLILNYELIKDDTQTNDYLNDLLIIDYQFDKIIQLLSLIILNLSNPLNYQDFLIKYSKINYRIYNLNIQFFCQLFLITILQYIDINHDIKLIDKFLNQFILLVESLSHELILESNHRLSLSDSNISSLSLVNDESSILTDQSPLSKNNYFNKDHDQFNIDNLQLDSSDLLSTITIDYQPNEYDSLFPDLDLIRHESIQKSIDIDQLEDLDEEDDDFINPNLDSSDQDDQDDIIKIASNDSTENINDSDDSTFDLLNSFGTFNELDDNSVNDQNLSSPSSKKIMRVTSRASIISSSKNLKRFSILDLKKRPLIRTSTNDTTLSDISTSTNINDDNKLSTKFSFKKLIHRK